MYDTIAAISTPLGVGGISIIRISGKDAIKIANKVFKGPDLTRVNSHTVCYGHIYDNNKLIDEVLLTIMKKPNTFTKEDVVEINCHGGIITTNQVLESVLNNGARLAEPGEFTKRAFLNGRIDLTQAEAIMDIIDSKTITSKELALNGLSGNISNLIKDLRKKIFDIIGVIEVNIDYPEYDDVEQLTNELLLPRIKEIKKDFKKIIEESSTGKIIKEGIKTVIIGRPNVGKSSILNKLLDEEKAIVTDIAGTTRDLIEGSINIGGILLNIIDTAGIRETSDVIEKIGVTRSLNELEKADLVITVLNNNEELTNDDLLLLEKTKNIPSIIVINKVDLPQKLDYTVINNRHLVKTNTLSKEGISELINKIKELFNLEKIKTKDLNYLSNTRQISLMKKSLALLETVEEDILNNQPIDMIEMDLKTIWTTLGEIIGQTFSEELIDEIFKNFCLGK